MNPNNENASNQQRARQHYKFTPEELAVIRECNRESFYQRCVPFSTIFGVSTYYGVQAGHLSPNPRWGAVPKVVVSVIGGYFLGKLSYQHKCAEKLMQLPNSPVGEMLRRRRSGAVQENSEPGFGPGMSLAPFSGLSTSDVYTDLNPRNNVDIDTSRPQYDGLDDSYRPSLDNPVYEEEMPPQQKHVTSYEELRKQNRDEYQLKRSPNLRETPVSPSPSPPSASSTKSFGEPVKHRNQYGDVVE